LTKRLLLAVALSLLSAPAWAGSAGKLAKFASTSTIVNSIMTETGSTVTVNGTMQALTLAGNGSLVTNISSATHSLTASTAAYAVNSGTAAYSVNSGTATYSVNSGTATYSVNSGTATYSVNSGTATYSVNSGTATYSVNSGTAAYATTTPAGATPAYLQPGNPTNITSTAFQMFGLGSTLKITPLKTGKVRFTISFFPGGVGSTATNNFKISYGSGAAPVNGAAASGTVIGGTYSGGAIVSVSATPTPIIRNVVVTGLSVGTAYWFDVQGARNTANTSVGLGGTESTVEELPY